MIVSVRVSLKNVVDIAPFRIMYWYGLVNGSLRTPLLQVLIDSPQHHPLLHHQDRQALLIYPQLAITQVVTMKRHLISISLSMVMLNDDINTYLVYCGIHLHYILQSFMSWLLWEREKERDTCNKGELEMIMTRHQKRLCPLHILYKHTCVFLHRLPSFFMPTLVLLCWCCESVKLRWVVLLMSVCFFPSLQCWLLFGVFSSVDCSFKGCK